MVVDLSEVVSWEDRIFDAEFPIEWEWFESSLGRFPITQKTTLQLHAENVEGLKLKLSGRAKVQLTAPCDRCLEDVPIDVELEFEKECPILDKILVVDELDQWEFLKDLSLDTEKLVFHELLLNWPMKVLCREDCKGICTKCGCNLNLKECGCDRAVLDPRMAAIQDLFNKFKEV